MKGLLTAVFSIALLFGGTYTANAAVAPADLPEYLDEIHLTQAELEEYLASYDMTIADFEDVEELRDTLGPRVTSENLEQLLKDYEMSKEELKSLLEEYGELEGGKTIEDSFLFLTDIEDIILMDSDYDLSELDESDLISAFNDLFTELGITEDEINNLLQHMDQLETNDPALTTKLEGLAQKMEGFADFETIDELSPTQLASLMSMTNELKQLLQMDFSFYLVNDGVKKPISFKNLITLKNTNGASLLVEVYNTSGKLLLDFILTGDMIGSDLIHETGDVIKNTTEKVNAHQGSSTHQLAKAKTIDKEDSATAHKTVKGGILPNTAGNYWGAMAAGLVLLAAAFFTFRAARAAK